MATLLNNDFVIKSGLVVEGTSVVSTSTSTSGSVQISSGLLVSKNFIVKSTATFLGKFETFNDSIFHAGLTIRGVLTASDYVFALVSTASNLTGGTAQSVVIQSSTGTTAFVPIGQPKQYLSVSNSNTVAWQSFELTEVGFAGTATNLKNGNTGQIPYQSADGVTNFIITGTTGNVLVSNGGSSAPTFTNNLINLSTISVGNLTVTNFSNLGSVNVTSLTATNITISNVLRVNGSTYLAGDLYVDGTQFTLDSEILSSGNKIIALSTTSARSDFADGAGILVGSTNANLAYARFLYEFNDGISSRWKSNIGILTTDTAPSNSTDTGALQVVGGAGIGGNLYVGNQISALNLRATGNTESTSNTSGALVVIGGVGISKNLFVGGAAYFLGGVAGLITNVGTFTRVIITGTNVALTVTNSAYIGSTLTVRTIQVFGTLASTSSAIANSLYVAGGIGTDGTITARDIYSNGFKVAVQGNSVSTLIAGTDTAVNTSTGNVTVWNTSTLQSVTSRGATSNVAVSLTNNTSSTSTATGALTVRGGVGIGNNLYVGGSLHVLGNGFVDNSEIITTATIGNYAPKILSTSSSTLRITNITQSTSTITGALVVDGGVGIGGNLYIGGNFSIAGSFQVPSFIGNLQGVASTASTVVTSNNIDSTYYFPTFVLNDVVTPGAQVLHTSEYFKIKPNSGSIVFGDGLIANSQVSIITDVDENTTGLTLYGANSNQATTDLNIIRSIPFGESANAIPFNGANISLSGGDDSTTRILLQEYLGGLLFFANNGQTDGQMINVMTLNRDRQLLINHEAVYDGLSGILNVNGDGYFVGVVTATTFIGNLEGTAANAQAIATIENTQDDLYYPTFVNTNSNSLINQQLYTTNTLRINPSTGVVSITNDTSSTSTNTGALVVTGGVGIGGTVYANSLIARTVGTRGTIYIGQKPASVIGGGDIVYDGGTDGEFYFNNFASSTGSTYFSSSGTLLLGIFNSGRIQVYSTITSTSTTSGALIISGGVGISKDVNVGGSINISRVSYINNSEIITTATLQNFVSSSGVNSLTAGTDTAINTSSGAVTIWNISTLQSVTDRGSSTNVAISITNNTSSTSTATGALTVTGGVGIGGAVWIGTTSFVAGAQVLTTATISTFAVTRLTAGTDTAISTSTGNVTVWSTSTLQTVTGRGSTTTAAISITNATASTGTNTGALTVTGGMGIGGNLYVANTSFVAGAQILTTATISTFAVTRLTAGTDTVVSTATGNVTVWASSTLQTVTGRGSTTTAAISITNTTSSTSTNTGALTVIGGVGIGDNLWVGGAITATSIYVGSSPVLTAQTIGAYGVSSLNGLTGTVVISAGTDTAIFNSGTTITIWNTSTLQSVTNRGSTTSNAISITNTQTSVSSTSGALTVAGGVGIGGNLFVAGTITANIVSIQYTTVTSVGVTTDDVIYTYNSTPSTGTTTGALVVGGGVGIGGAVWIGETSYVVGAQILTTATIGTFAVTRLTAGTDTAISTATGDITIWNTSTLQTVTGRGSSTTAAISITNATASTGTNTGALVVTGGVGIGGNLYVANISYIAGAQILTTATIGNFGVSKITAGTDTAISTATGDVTIWSTSTLETVTSRGSTTTSIIFINNNTASTGTATGALTVRGGVGIGGSLNVANTSYIANAQILTTATINAFVVTRLAAGTDTAISTATGDITIWNTSTLQTVTGRGSTTTAAISITNTQSSTSTATGALTVTGGVGIGGAVWIGTTSYIAGAQILTTATLGNFAISQVTAGTDTAVSIVSGNVTIWNTSTLQSVTGRGSSTTAAISITNATASTSTTTGALVVTGGVGIGGTVNIGGSSTGTINAVTYGNTLLASYTSGVLTTTSSVTLDSFSTSTYRSAKYFCQVTSGTNSVHISEISVFHAAGISYINEYGISVNNTILGVYDATIVGGNLNITFTPSTTAATVVKMTRLTLTI